MTIEWKMFINANFANFTLEFHSHPSSWSSMSQKSYSFEDLNICAKLREYVLSNSESITI